MINTKLLQALLWLIYPLVIFFGLQIFEPRHVAILLGITLLLRWRLDASRLVSGLSRIDLVVLVSLLIFTSITAVTNSEPLLRFYPATMNLGMLLLFGFSLKYPPSMIERFARLKEPNLSLDGVFYTRRVTQVWCVFFIANGALATYTALYSNLKIWALYNGFIVYFFIGALLVGEWFVRRHRLARRPVQ